MAKESGKLKKVLRDQTGFSMLMALFALIILSILTISILGITANNLVQSEGERSSQSAYYIAEGGAAKILSEIEAYAQSIDGTFVSEEQFYDEMKNQFVDQLFLVDSFQLNQGEQPSAEITVEQLDESNPREYRLTSSGKIGEREREVATRFLLQFHPWTSFQWPDDTALFTQQQVQLTGSTSITGSIGTMSTASGSIRFLNNNVSVSNSIFVPAGAEDKALDMSQSMKQTYQDKVKPYEAAFSFDVPVFPEYPSYPYHSDLVVNGQSSVPVTTNRSYQTISISGSSSVLTFDVGNQDREIVVDNFDLNSGAKIEIAGTGKLTVYIRSRMGLSNGSFNMASTKDRLNIYMKGSGDLIFDSKVQINGSLFAENANITIKGTGGFYGNIVTGGSSVIFSGASYTGKSLIYAPKADVQLVGGSIVEGAILSKTYYAEGESKLHSATIDSDELPFLDEIDKKPVKIDIERKAVRES